MALKYVIDKDNLTVVCPPSLNADNAHVFKDEFEEYFKKECPYKSVIIDLHNLPYIDSAVLGFLLFSKQLLDEKAVTLSIGNPSEKVRDILEKCHFDKVVTIL